LQKVIADMQTSNSANKHDIADAKTIIVQADWFKFPMLEEVFEHSPGNMIAHLVAQHKEFQSLEESGTPADRVRARLISVSYARTCELLRELEAAQAEIIKKHATEPTNLR
jgi:hypothetical protein